MINDNEKKANEQMVIVQILVRLWVIRVIAIRYYMGKIQE